MFVFLITIEENRHRFFIEYWIDYRTPFLRGFIFYGLTGYSHDPLPLKLSLLLNDGKSVYLFQADRSTEVPHSLEEIH